MPAAGSSTFACALLTAVLLFLPLHPAGAEFLLGPPDSVSVAAGDHIQVRGYSVPSYFDWDSDGQKDLIVGEGGGAYSDGKVRVYLNEGSNAEPLFTEFFYAQSLGSDLVVPAGSCLGAFPRVVYWDADTRKDLLVGQSDGTLKLFLNVGTEEAPEFDGGVFLQVGEPGAKQIIDIGGRATPTVLDWDEDGRKDLVVGSYHGKINLFLNAGSDTLPDFPEQLVLPDNGVEGTELVIPYYRSSPQVADLDEDGKKDLLVGNTAGQLLLYANVGTNEAPVFSEYVAVEGDGIPIDLEGSARSRPCLCDWTGDGRLDVLIGGSDGRVHLYQGVPVIGVPGESPRVTIRLASYPNPFRSGASIRFVLPTTGHARLTVYDLAGRPVARILDQVLSEGPHERTWTGMDRSGRPVPAGVYFAYLEAGGVSVTRKLIRRR